MARPLIEALSSNRQRIGKRKERSHAYFGSRDRPGQEQLQRGWAGFYRQVVVRRRMRREIVITYAAKLPTCIVAMEACCGAHQMGRVLAMQGRTVRLMSPEYVRPYVKAQKNDGRDAEAIAEAAARPTMRVVELKTEAQLDMQTLHRVRDQLVGERTSIMNQIRSPLLERGHIVPQGRAKLAARLGWRDARCRRSGSWGSHPPARGRHARALEMARRTDRSSDRRFPALA